jgi:peptidoglycan endopeptidase LytE
MAYAQLPGTTVHVVEPGDTLWSIGERLGVDTSTLVRLNNLDNGDLLSIGQSLKVPAGSDAAATSSPSARRASTTGSATYTVVGGDTLWSIAERLGVDTGTLVGLNDLDNADLLSIGMQLTLPGGAAARPSQPVAAPALPTVPARSPGRTTSYTVEAGDTLTRIARQYDSTVSALATANSLDDPNRLSIGMVLTVPGAAGAASAVPAAAAPGAPSTAPSPARQHIVRVGETLKDIAAQEKVDLGALIDFNALDDPEVIRVGQVVRVPPSPNATAPAEQTLPATATLSAASTRPNPPAPAPAAAPRPAAPPKPAAAAPAPAPKPSTPAPVGQPTEGLATYALKFVGSRYVFGGSSPAGFDCSGFVWYVARQMGKPIPRGMMGEYNAGSHPSRDQLKPGDIVFFQNTYMPGVSHNGFYLGDNKFVHAASERSGVTVSDLASGYWSSRWFGATRLS